MRSAIKGLPTGRHAFEITLDGCGDPIFLQCAITIGEDGITVDNAGTSGMVDLGVNVGFNYTVAYTTYGVKCAIAPEAPNNAGSFQPIRTLAPVGSVLNAQPPAAVAGRHTVAHFLPSAIMGALSGILPDKVTAPRADSHWNTHIAGHSRQGDYFSFTWFSTGGTVALKGKDGLSATSYPSGVAEVPAEIIEALIPWLYERALRPHSGDAGTSRGGLGQTMEIKVQTDRPYLVSDLYECCTNSAQGLDGGC